MLEINLNDNKYFMGNLLQGICDVMAEFETGKKEVNGFRKYASFKDPVLQFELDSYRKAPSL